jgi:hypothetical protein
MAWNNSSGHELDRFEFDSLSAEAAVLDAGPDLTVHRRRMQVPQLDLGFRLRDRGPGMRQTRQHAGPGAGCQTGLDAGSQKITSLHLHVLLLLLLAPSMGRPERSRPPS